MLFMCAAFGCRHHSPKCAQLRGGSELWNRVELSECRCEGIRQAPHGSGWNSACCGLKSSPSKKDSEEYGAFYASFSL